MVDANNFSLKATSAVPVEKVSAGALTGTQQAPDLSFLGLFFQADFIVQMVIITLLVASVWSWAIVFEKISIIRSIKRSSTLFQRDFWSGVSLESLHETMLQKSSQNPLIEVFCAAMKEWKMRNNVNLQNQNLHAGTKERIKQAMLIAGSRSLERVEKNLGFLATVGSSATFIGLFGTVWGIMVSFQSIAISKNTTLAVVAPGIAEALLATACGLVAAIPAMIFYNKFVSDLNRIADNVSNFSNELSSILSRELDKIK